MPTNEMTRIRRDALAERMERSIRAHNSSNFPPSPLARLHNNTPRRKFAMRSVTREGERVSGRMAKDFHGIREMMQRVSVGRSVACWRSHSRSHRMMKKPPVHSQDILRAMQPECDPHSSYGNVPTFAHCFDGANKPPSSHSSLPPYFILA